VTALRKFPILSAREARSRRTHDGRLGLKLSRYPSASKTSVNALGRGEGRHLVGQRQEMHRTLAETHSVVAVAPGDGVFEPVLVVALGVILAGVGAAAFGAKSAEWSTTTA
jgi:hypothetical protein